MPDALDIATAATGGANRLVTTDNAVADTHPDWYRNLLTHSEVTAEIGTETRASVAHTANLDEREPIWNRPKADYPGFAGYEANTTRVIPVVILEPVLVAAATESP